MQEMHRIFDRSSTRHDAGREILQLRQGSNSVSDFAIEFQTLVTDSGWEGRALDDAFLYGLSEHCHTRQRSPVRYGPRRHQPSPPASSLPTPTSPGGRKEPEAMMVDHSRLTREERERQVRNQACLYCGGAGHFASKCPVKDHAH